MATIRQTVKKVKANSSNLLLLSFTYTKPSKAEHCGQTTRRYTSLQTVGKTSRERSKRSCRLDLIFTLIQNSLNYVAFGMLKNHRFYGIFHKDMLPVQRQRVKKSSCHCCWQLSPAKDVLDSKRDFYHGLLSLRKITF